MLFAEMKLICTVFMSRQHCHIQATTTNKTFVVQLDNIIALMVDEMGCRRSD
jgi:hypothetical protein